jgi:hypothetical protein
MSLGTIASRRAAPRPTARKTATSNVLPGQQNVHRPVSSSNNELPFVKHLLIQPNVLLPAKLLLIQRSVKPQCPTFSSANRTINDLCIFLCHTSTFTTCQAYSRANRTYNYLPNNPSSSGALNRNVQPSPWPTERSLTS